MFFVAAFVACFLVQGVLLNRLISLGNYYITGGTFIYFVSPLISDVVAEVYGYRVARQMLWLGLFAIIFMTTCSSLVIRAPYPPFWKSNAEAYFISMHALIRATIAGIIAVLIGQFINIYLMSKWKILLRGRYFWLRSAGSSIIGDAVTVSISILLIFWGRVPTQLFTHLLIPELIIMVLFSSLGAVPALVIAKLTAKFEGINTYDVGVNFNPFKLGLEDKDSSHNDGEIS